MIKKFFPTNIIDIYKGNNRRNTNDSNFILSNLSPRYPDNICPKNPVNKIAETIELEFSPKSILKTEGINVLKIVNDKPTTNDIIKKIFNIEF
jgi:hypothetical protein